MVRPNGYHPSSFTLENLVVSPILEPFWGPFGTRTPKIIGNQLLELSGNGVKELIRSENGVVGQKISL